MLLLASWLAERFFRLAFPSLCSCACLSGTLLCSRLMLLLYSLDSLLHPSMVTCTAVLGERSASGLRAAPWTMTRLRHLIAIPRRQLGLSRRISYPVCLPLSLGLSGHALAARAHCSACASAYCRLAQMLRGTRTTRTRATQGPHAFTYLCFALILSPSTSVAGEQDPGGSSAYSRHLTFCPSCSRVCMAAGESWLGQFELPHRLGNGVAESGQGSRPERHSSPRVHLIVDLWPPDVIRATQLVFLPLPSSLVAHDASISSAGVTSDLTSVVGSASTDACDLTRTLPLAPADWTQVCCRETPVYLTSGLPP